MACRAVARRSLTDTAGAVAAPPGRVTRRCALPPWNTADIRFPPARIVEIQVAKHRVEALSDGVYAIAITLLVLELKLPALAEGATDAALRHALIELMPRLLVWLLSFWVMAVFWLGQQRLHRYSTILDRPAVLIELSQLALVSLLPFSTALMGEHGDHAIAAAIYSLNLLGLALLSLARVLHFLRKPAMQSPDLPAAVRTTLRWRAWGVAAFCAVTLALAFVVPGWNMLAMLPLAVLPMVARRQARVREPTPAR